MIMLYLSDPLAFAGELRLPATNEIISFANNPNFQYNSGDIYQKLSRRRLLKFLREGKIIPAKTQPDDLELKGHVTFHEPLLPWQRDEIEMEIKSGGTGESLLRCQGTAATKKAIYFWELLNDRVFWIANEQGDGCFLRID